LGKTIFYPVLVIMLPRSEISRRSLMIAFSSQFTITGPPKSFRYPLILTPLFSHVASKHQSAIAAVQSFWLWWFVSVSVTWCSLCVGV